MAESVGRFETIEDLQITSAKRNVILIALGITAVLLSQTLPLLSIAIAWPVLAATVANIATMISAKRLKPAFGQLWQGAVKPYPIVGSSRWGVPLVEAIGFREFPPAAQIESLMAALHRRPLFGRKAVLYKLPGHTPLPAVKVLAVLNRRSESDLLAQEAAEQEASDASSTPWPQLDSGASPTAVSTDAPTMLVFENGTPTPSKSDTVEPPTSVTQAQEPNTLRRWSL